MAKILVVDDALFARTKMRQVLATAGHEVIEATDGLGAVEQYCRERPDATLLDITMPHMDGLVALAMIRRLDPAARVAMVTAMGQESSLRDALSQGACDFIVKPFRAERVLASVQKMLAGPRGHPAGPEGPRPAGEAAEGA